MAELVVKAHYDSKLRVTMLAALRMTFPIWGILCPVIAAGIVCFALASLRWISSWDAVSIYASYSIVLASLFSFISGLIGTRWLSMDSIVADKNGLQFPFLSAGYGARLYKPWQSIRKVAVTPSTADWKQQTLLFYGKKGGPMSLSLARLQERELEQLLLAIEMWADQSEKDPSFKELQSALQQNTPKNVDQSYTNMWEEELRRRFCATAFMPMEPGTLLRKGSLKVVRQLALGGLSAVYLCQLDGSKLVVLKEAVIPEDSPLNIRDKAREMFEREASLLMKINHPNIVHVQDYFIDEGRNYLMLEYVAGQDLRQYVKQNGPQRETVVIEWAIQIANILKYLHEQDPSIIHRDLTPDNLVMRDDGTIVLIDFGAANEFIGNATGTFVGKQSFIAPEQFRGKAVTQSDIYAFGCTLNFFLTGEEPEALSVSSPRILNPSVSEELNEIVSSCTQLEARDRFQTAAQLLPVLRKLAATLVVA